jgi:hypothetical protein
VTLTGLETELDELGANLQFHLGLHAFVVWLYAALATATALAETLVARASDLRRLLATYRRAIEEHRRPPGFFDSDSAF